MMSGCDRARLTRYRIILGIAAALLWNVSMADDDRWKAFCDQAEKKPVVIPRPAGPLSDAQLPKCDEEVLYYGIGQHPDYAAALQCAWFQREHRKDMVDSPFSGAGVLTMLYANGQGVPRNYDVAMRLSCEIETAAEAELSGRFAHLLDLRDAAKHGTFELLDLCDDVTAGINVSSCFHIDAAKDDIERGYFLQDIVRGLSDEEKAAFPALHAAETAFEHARCDKEVELSGTLRGMFILQEKARLRDQFLINLQRFAAGTIPPASEADLAKLETQLNMVYRKIQTDKNWDSTGEKGTIEQAGIKDTERKWIALADAWTAYGRIAYPKLSAARMRAQLIRLRLHQLRALLE